MRAGTRTRLAGYFDAITAAAAVAVIVAPHWPWYVATLNPPDGTVIAPSGTATGISAHPTLWAVIGLAAAQLALLLARHLPGGRRRVPGDKGLLVLGAALARFLVVAMRTSCRTRGPKSCPSTARQPNPGSCGRPSKT